MTTNTDIAALHDNIKAAIAAKFPDAHVGYYERPFEKAPKSPSIFLHLGEIDANDPQTDGADALECVLHWSAFVIVRFRDPNAKRSLRVMSAELMRFLRGERFNGTGADKFIAGPCVVAGAFPDEMNPTDDGYEVFRVEWTQEAKLGAPTEPDPVPVAEVLTSGAPAIGDTHESKYARIVL